MSKHVRFSGVIRKAVYMGSNDKIATYISLPDDVPMFETDIYIKKVIYSKPVTVIVWSDGTRTTSRCAAEDIYNPEMGFINCYLKKLLGSKKLHQALREWLPKNTDGARVVFLKDVRKYAR